MRAYVGAQDGTRVGYVPLPACDFARLDRERRGTLFGGRRRRRPGFDQRCSAGGPRRRRRRRRHAGCPFQAKYRWWRLAHYLLFLAFFSVATTAESSSSSAKKRRASAIPPSAFFADTEWTPLFADKHFGIWPLLSGTLLTTAIALVVALPLGLLAAIYLAEFARPRTRRMLKPTLEVLAGVPTVVYGYFAMMSVTPALQRVIPDLAGFNALGPGIVMGVMILPVVASLTEDAIFAVSSNLAKPRCPSTKLATVSVILPSPPRESPRP